MASNRTQLHLPVGVAAIVGTLLAAPAAWAQSPLPAVLPEVLFLVEESDAMNSLWTASASLPTPSTRWTYVKEALLSVINQLPTGITVGVALTANGSGVEPDDFEQLAYPGIGTTAAVAAITSYQFIGGTNVTTATSLSQLMDTWAENAYTTPRNWTTGPWQFSCSDLQVIIIGFSTGVADGSPVLGNFTSDSSMPNNNNVGCNNGGVQACYLDNVANHANNTLNPPLAPVGSITISTILIDAAAATIDASNLYYTTAASANGDGIAYQPVVPGGIATSIWGVLTNAYDGEYSNAAISVSPDGDRLFASYFEVTGGHPLYKGHLLAWALNNDPTTTSYGEIIPGSGTANSIWDAGLLLASRLAEHKGVNQNTSGYTNFNLLGRRTIYTSYAAEVMYSTPMPFDSTQVAANSDLVNLLVTSYSSFGNSICADLTGLDQDWNFDCAVDDNDAQVLVDFLRGVPTATFWSTGLPRGPWKMGDTGNSVTVIAPASLEAIATENHFIAYRDALALLPGMVYIASNAAMIHAFRLDGVPVADQGSEWWAYIPRHKLTQSPATVGEFDGFMADDLMRTGQTYVNDGRLSLEHVWLDGYMNGLTGCAGPGYFPAQANQTIHVDGCEWHRVLLWSGGYGSSHHYALDVTNPDLPRFLWEKADLTSSGAGRGRSMSAPVFASFWDNSGSVAKRRWIAVWGGGGQAPGVVATGSATNFAQAAIYIQDIDASTSLPPTTYNAAGFSVAHPGISSQDSDPYEEYIPPEYGMFGTPAIADLDGDASVDVAYIGDSMGYTIKILFNEQSPNSPTRCIFGTPAANDQAKHIYYPPSLFYSGNGDLNVFYGSGSPYNIYDAVTGGLYAYKDPTPYGCTPGIAATCTTNSSLFSGSTFYQFSGVGEKMVGSPTTRFGRMFFATHIPGSDLCTLGNSRLYGLSVSTCEGGLFDDTTDSYSVVSNLYTELPGLISEPVFANGQMYALNIDAGGLDANSVIDNFNVTPNNFVSHVYMTFRHVF
jgi:hypothetical protein